MLWNSMKTRFGFHWMNFYFSTLAAARVLQTFPKAHLVLPKILVLHLDCLRLNTKGHKTRSQVQAFGPLIADSNGECQRLQPVSASLCHQGI